MSEGYKHTWNVGDTYPSKNEGCVTIKILDGSYSHCYIECSICHADKELFPDLLYVNKYKLKNKQQVCACGKTYKWNERQYKVRVQRRVTELGYKLLGWVGEYKGIDTRLDMVCGKGHKYSPSIDGFLGSKKPKCRTCSNKETHAKQRFSQEYADQLARSLEDNYHTFVKWENEIYENNISRAIFHCNKNNLDVEYTLQSMTRSRAKLPCCHTKGGFNSKEEGKFYLSLWGDENEGLFLKYGITNGDACTRLKSQSRKTKYEGDLLLVIHFTKGIDALNLERAIKALYKRRRVSRNDFIDGYTETLHYEGMYSLWDIIPDISAITGLTINSINVADEDLQIKLQGDCWVEDLPS